MNQAKQSSQANDCVDVSKNCYRSRERKKIMNFLYTTPKSARRKYGLVFPILCVGERLKNKYKLFSDEFTVFIFNFINVCQL